MNELMCVKSPSKEWDLPFKKNDEGNYIIFPNHIGGKNCLRDLAKSKTSIGYVYFIRIEGATEYKIGVSENPKRRLRDISSHLPYQLNLLSIHLLKNPYLVEEFILKKYNKFLLKNEWFKFDVNIAKEIMIYLHNKQVDESREATKHE